jgi:16S rRNA (uracil1498-N3)-methyltransferase
MPRFFADVTGSAALISGRDVKHITGPLRKRSGDEILIREGVQGFKAKITGITKNEINLEIIEKQVLCNRGKARVHLGISLIDIREMDDAIRFTAELGVESICPVIAGRSNIRAISQARLKRWEDIIMESVKQSQRRTFPRLESITALPEFVRLSESRFTRRYFASMEGETGILDIRDEEMCFLIGPEGGFTEHEFMLFNKCGYTPVNMGRTTLRTLAAAVAAASILCI